MKKLLISILLLTNACALKTQLSDVSNRYIEEVDISDNIKNVPFTHAWVREGLGHQKFDLYIEPVILNFEKDVWKKSLTAIIPNEESFLKEAQLIADYFYEQILKSIKEQKGQIVNIVNVKNEDTVTMQTALTELVFAHPVVNVASLASPIPGTGLIMSTITKPHMSMAVRFLARGKLMGTLADRKYPPARIVDLNQFTVTSSNREIARIWAKTLAESLENGRFVYTKKRGFFRFLPW